MQCDEQYRKWAMRQAAADVPPADLHRALLRRVTSCPARPGFRELHFDVAGTSWSWCLPGPARADGGNPPVRLLIFRPGPCGIMAQAVTGQAGDLTPPATSDLAMACDLAISGVPVFIHRFLLRQETSKARPGPPAIEVGRRC